ncbi:uncharacterized protein FOMMEDRAFT_155641 [Fomitiporia mediterranea MF3/22]|uniref:uncharacterized protein n=1 Tax=Fomitiporia mediterranea (strain MF3/22) TaxID=694068 RepID=UPI0004408F26|nr:uncharacterized protein FOMMEDRAFT_155641 [Fomitiporia mediterranea MF3/22]EJD04501.1 hypothetical protein FOMMEDRAFT_155641 [Fomitiporia mediterranea MF3/22]
MSSAAARAEARRKAILSRGNDRLNRLTNSARGEDNPVYAHVDVPPRKAPTTETFVGEETIMPTPPARPSPSPAPAPPASSHPHAGATNQNESGPSAWTTEQQQEFMRALMSAPDRSSSGPGSAPSHPFGAPTEPGSEAPDDPMAALMNALAQMTGQAPPNMGGPGAMNMNIPGMDPTTMNMNMNMNIGPRPRSLYSKLRPLLHLLASWTLLAFFAFFMEPKEFDSVHGSRATLSTTLSTWDRWAELGWKSTRRPFGVQPVPFFWAFVTLQLILHSIQLFTKADPIQPPTLLAMALPILPPQWRSLVTNVLVYLRMIGILLDDVAGVVVGVGVLIWVAAWGYSFILV